MLKYVILLASLAYYASAGFVGTPIIGNLVGLPPQPATQGDPTIFGYLLGYAFNGVAVSVTPTGDFQLGGLTLPPDVLCNYTDVTLLVSCHICFLDCTYIHNRYGGNCSMDTTPGKQPGKVCVCGDELPEGGIGNATNTCGPLTTTNTDAAVGSLIQQVLRLRYEAEQCPFGDYTYAFDNDVGCSIDCLNNHQYWTGSCVQDYPVYQTNGTLTDYCECSLTDPGNTYTQVTSTLAPVPTLPVTVPTTNPLSGTNLVTNPANPLGQVGSSVGRLLTGRR